MVKDGLDGGIGSLIDGPSREDGRWQKRMVYLYINLSIAGEGGLLGGFPPYKKIGLTGPVSIYKLLPEVFFPPTHYFLIRKSCPIAPHHHQ